LTLASLIVLMLPYVIRSLVTIPSIVSARCFFGAGLHRRPARPHGLLSFSYPATSQIKSECRIWIKATPIPFLQFDKAAVLAFCAPHRLSFACCYFPIMSWIVPQTRRFREQSFNSQNCACWHRNRQPGGKPQFDFALVAAARWIAARSLICRRTDAHAGD
jgi:hypothetical protein